MKESGDDSETDSLRAVAGLEGDVVQEALLRFPVSSGEPFDLNDLHTGKCKAFE